MRVPDSRASSGRCKMGSEQWVRKLDSWTQEEKDQEAKWSLLEATEWQSWHSCGSLVRHPALVRHPREQGAPLSEATATWKQTVAHTGQETVSLCGSVFSKVLVTLSKSSSLL